MQADLAHERVRMERRRRVWVEERDEGAALLGEDADALDGSEADLREELVDGRVRGEVADVHRAGLRGALDKVSMRHVRKKKQR